MKIAINNVHLDLGAGRRGTDMGPSAMHVAGLIPKLQKLGHDVTSVKTTGFHKYELFEPKNPKARFLDEIYQTCLKLRNNVREELQTGCFPLVLGGDHSQAMGTISGICQHYQEQNQDIGVLWVDAHTDLNTPDTSPSGNIHGMPLATLLGHGPQQLVGLSGPKPILKPKNVVIFGARDVDSTEAPLVGELGIRVYTMQEIDERGTALCIREAIDYLLERTSGIHLSFDLDGVDPEHAPGVGTEVLGGLNLRESHLLCETIASTGKLVGMEMVELNPILDIGNKTAEFAVWLIQSALGKNIL